MVFSGPDFLVGIMTQKIKQEFRDFEGSKRKFLFFKNTKADQLEEFLDTKPYFRKMLNASSRPEQTKEKIIN